MGRGGSGDCIGVLLFYDGNSMPLPGDLKTVGEFANVLLMNEV